VVFADQVVNLFTTHIGNWAYLFIAVAAFATMFSTCMTAHDAISRVSLDVLEKLFPKKESLKSKNAFAIMVLCMALVNWAVITLFGANMGHLVALATFVSFVLAPLLGWMNLKTVMGKDIPKPYKPKIGLQVLTYSGIVFLSLFALYYCWMLLM
jgi:Mn2+/Fe2+ NRAMP family transporter